MSVYLGVDFHARTQTVCWCDTADGLIRQRTLDHPQDDVRGFYMQFPAPAVVGLEATGYARVVPSLARICWTSSVDWRCLCHPKMRTAPAKERPA
jgi:hypothetical protein